MKAKQEGWQDRMAAGDWLEDQEAGSDIDAKLRAKGIGDSAGGASDVLARLKAKQAG